MDKKKKNSIYWEEITAALFLEINLNTVNTSLKNVDHVYHYTSLRTFISIVENQTLFCTNINFLNDSSEHKYGVDLIKQVIDEIRNDDNFSIINKLSENISRFFTSEKYITCYSKEGDSLSQWRAYGNDGKGISIGFNKRGLKNNFNEYLTEINIEYDLNIQKKTIHKIITQSIEKLTLHKKHFDLKNFKFDEHASKFIIMLLNDTINSFKHPAFEDEKEYRLQLEIEKNSKNEIRYKSSDSLIIPYTSIENNYHYHNRQEKDGNETKFIGIKKLPIEKIYVGPKLNFESVKTGLEMFLSDNGYYKVDIQPSKTPYR